MAGSIYEFDEATEEFHLRATDRMEEELIDSAARQSDLVLDERTTAGQAAISREPVQDPEYLRRERLRAAHAPMLSASVTVAAWRCRCCVKTDRRRLGGRRKPPASFVPK